MHMAAADFTRFDFHAKRFYFSDNVRIMSAEEVGQYILLMVEAWMGGKDASLPDNPKMLARMARVDVVSESVLAMFPVVETEHGPRRRNKTLYEEWDAALKRSKQAKKNVDARWGNDPTDEHTDEIPPYNDGNTHTSPSQVKSHQTGFGPNRPESSQSKSVQGPQPKVSVLSADRGAAAPDPADDQKQEQDQMQEPDFKLFRRLFNNNKFNLGHDKVTIARYTEACAKHGAYNVHAAIGAWATQRTLTWVKENNVKSPFGLFLSQLEKTIERMVDDKTVDVAMIEADAIAEKVPAVLNTKEAVAASDDVILKLAAEEERQRIARAAKFSAEAEVVIDPEKFLED